MELVLEETLSPTGKTSKPLRTRKGKTSGDEVSAMISIALTMVAQVRGNHWYRSSEDCKCLGYPLAEALDKLPAKTAKVVADLTLPISIISGAVMLLSGPIQVERQLAAQRKQKDRETQQHLNNGGGGPINDGQQSLFNANEGTHSVTTGVEGFGIPGYDGPTGETFKRF